MAQGSTTTFTVTPQAGYQVANVTGCSGSRSGNTYTTGAITAACSVSASFENSTPTWAAISNQAPAEWSVGSYNYSPYDINVGAIGSTAGVSGGQAKYSVPLQMAPGRAGMQPNVALDYQSRSGNGLLGVGFSLSAGSGISRCGPTVAQDGYASAVNYQLANDKLCLNGERLVNVEGSYGSSGTVYRTEVDSFTRVTQLGGNLNQNSAHFKVEYPQGRVAYFGSDSAEAKVVHTGKTETFSWLLAYEQDLTAKNYIHYVYSYNDNAEVLLDNIYYTGSSATQLGNRRVSFEYASRPDINQQYVAGGMVMQTKRLHQVTSFLGNTRLHRYTLSYQSSEASQRSLLKSITQCSYLSGTQQCLPSTVFDWQDEAVNYQLEKLAFNNSPVYQSERTIDGLVPHGDINGDGVRDWPNKFVSAEGNVIGSHTFELKNCIQSPLSRRKECVEGDFDNNGLTDGWDVVNGKLVLLMTQANLQRSNINTNIPLQSRQIATSQQDHIRHIGDFNGDGWPDLVIYRFNSGTPKLDLYLHSKNKSAPYSVSSVSNLHQFHTVLSGNELIETTTVEFIGDIDGNGLPDMAVSAVNAFQDGHLGRFNPVPVLQGFRLNASTGNSINFNWLSFNPFTNNEQYFSYLIDINGDGLPDWLGWAGSSTNLHARINKGAGEFTELTDLGIALAQRSYTVVHSNDEREIFFEPKYRSSFRVMDINHDGKAEFLIPAERVATSCTKVNTSTGLITACGDDLYKSYKLTVNSNTTSVLDVSRIDDSVYRFNAVNITIDSTGALSATTVPTAIYASATENFATDAFGKGLTDLVFAYGPRFADTTMGNVGGAMAGRQFGVYINKNRGSANAGQGYAPSDMLKSVTNGLGKYDSWAYLPLSSSQGRLNNLPFYLADRSYVDDGQHFNFASSMYVVAEYNSSNGVGGLNSTRYAYRGAMYHTQGRGFRGFRAIISEDTSSGLITHTDFRQKFPFTGQIRGQFVFSANAYPSGYPVIGYSSNGATGADSAISAQVNNWQLNTVHRAANSVASCNSQYRSFTDETDLTCPAGGIYSVYKAGSDTYLRDLTTKQLYSHTQSQVTSVDAFNNLLQASQTISDDSGIYASSSSATYSPQSGNPWAPHRLASLTKHSSPVQQLNTVISYPAALDTAKWIKTTYSNWHSSGAPQQVNTVASDGSQVQKVVTGLNAYGLPTNINRTASVMSQTGGWSTQSRSESIGYSNNNSTESSAGYFPFKLTNALGHVSYVHTAPATGQPLKQISANGITTSFSYDSFGRPATVQQSGQALQRISHDTTRYDSNAPGNASWMTVTTQAGGPQQRSYFDMFGRKLRVSVKGFNGSWINKDTQYNARGLVELTSDPYEQGMGGGFTQYADYDALGRPGNKQVPGGLSINYDYSGLVTEITAGGSLHMSRSYNSMNQLLHTEDANGGLTYYRYNGQGLPIVLQDANGVKLTASYNALGQKLSVNDPNQGNSSYLYNGFGELEQETDANGLAIRFDYDSLGRQTKRTSYSGSTVKDNASFSYDTALTGLPYQEVANGVTRTFGYDANANLLTNSLQLDGKTFTSEYFYHSATGQPTGMRYPNGLTVKYGYTPDGHLETVSNAASGYVYRTIDSQDALGNVLQASLGNGVNSNNQYDSDTGWARSLTAWRGNTRVHDVEYQQYDVFGNIEQVKNHITGATESYQYDELHRLTRSTYSNMGYTVPINYSYDAVGNLLSKSDYANTYRYGNAAKNLGGKAGSNAVRQVIKLNSSTVNFSYDNQGNLTAGDGLSISYNSFKQPTQISRGGNTFGFTYGANLERLKETRNGVTTYEIDKLYEEESNGNWRLFLSDIAIIKYDASNKHQIRYTHKDRLGSTLTYTDHNGQVTDRRMFDAFGKPRAVDGNTLTPPRLQNALLSRNGFTDHRHLDEVELIHMNGRAYDYNLGRFLSVDPIIQAPGNSQSLNPYSYIMNNPLAGTDPTGYCSKELGSNICRKELSSVQVSATLAGNVMAKMAQAAVNDNGARQSQPPAQAGQQTVTTDIESPAMKRWNQSKAKEIADKYEDVSTDVDVEIAAMQTDPNDLGQTASKGGRRGNTTRDPFQSYINARYNRLFNQIRELDPNFSVARPARRDVSRREVEVLEQHLSGIRGAPALDLTPIGGGTGAAYRAARRSLNIPMNARPTSVQPNRDNNGVIQPGFVEIFRLPVGNGTYRDVFIRHDSSGHYYGSGNIHNWGPHFNTGVMRNGRQDNDGGHYGY
uniref:Rhs family protein n=1 Tax=Rheinheimera sp. BAL341 TaxID=1708203 RepID=A0A486XPV6_9GAMM